MPNAIAGYAAAYRVELGSETMQLVTNFVCAGPIEQLQAHFSIGNRGRLGHALKSLAPGEAR